MNRLARNRSRIGLKIIALACLLTAVVPSLTPVARGQNFPGPLNNLTAGGILPLPPPPPQGAFYEVIFANAKWLVVQNQQGQQFPVSSDFISQLLIRWPASVSDLSIDVLVEAIGPQMTAMMIQSNHIDLFAGVDRGLVQPGYVSVLPINRPVTAQDPTFQRNMNGFDVAAQNTLYSFVFPVSTGDNGIPGQMHVVGNALGIDPLRLGVPGNNIVAVLPPTPGGMSISQVTTGSVSFAAKGDFAYLTPVTGNAVTDRSLRLSQVVLYKKMRRDRYVP